MLCKGVTYLLRGVNETAISEPADHRAELGLVLERKLMGNGVSRCGSPLNKLVTLGEPFSIDVCVELDLMRVPVVGDNFYTEVRERDRLIHEICRLRFR